MRWIYATLAGLLACLSVPAHATAQVGDVLLLDGKHETIFTREEWGQVHFLKNRPSRRTTFGKAGLRQLSDLGAERPTPGSHRSCDASAFQPDAIGTRA